MDSSFIPDAKHQELNISFTFDQHYQNKAFIEAMVGHNLYQLEFLFNPDSDFEDIKNALLSKQFKIVQRSPQILKLKISFAHFLFKNIEKINFNTLKQSFAELNQKVIELNNKIKDKSEKNIFNEQFIKELKSQFDLMREKMADLKLINEKKMEQMIKIINSERERSEQKVEEEKHKRLQLQENFNFIKKRVEKLEGEILNQLEANKNMRVELERISNNHDQKIRKVEQELVQKMEDKEKIKDKKLQKFYQEKLRMSQQRVEQEKRKREQWEMVKKQQEQQLKMRLIKGLKELDEVKQKLKQNKKVKELEERVGRFEQERGFYERNLKMIVKDMIKQVQQDRVKQQAKQQEEELRKLDLERIERVSTQNKVYCFSQKHKHQSITLQNQNLKATIQSWLNSGLALVEGLLFDKGSSIRFKISSIGMGAIAVGFGIKNVIAKNNYQIPSWNQVGHGCFLIRNGGSSYSHLDKDQNNVGTDFKYAEGDAIKVERNGDKLVWMNESTMKEFRMKVKLTTDQWADTYFCVCLAWSSVQIIK